MFNELNEEEKELIRQRYELKKSVYDVCFDLYISESTFYRRQREIYEKFINYYEIFEQLFTE